MKFFKKKPQQEATSEPVVDTYDDLSARMDEAAATRFAALSASADVLHDLLAAKHQFADIAADAQMAVDCYTDLRNEAIQAEVFAEEAAVDIESVIANV